MIDWLIDWLILTDKSILWLLYGFANSLLIVSATSNLPTHAIKIFIFYVSKFANEYIGTAMSFIISILYASYKI